MTEEKPTTWRTYEEVAQYLLNDMSDKFGLDSVEGKQALQGFTGTTWEIDGKGVKDDGDAIILIECRRYLKDKLNQEAIAAIAYRIGDLNAAGGIVVTPIGVQSGGELVAKHENITIVQLNADATTTDYVLKFLKQVFIGASASAVATVTATVTAVVTRAGVEQP
ncbi:hypothetical protein ABIA30_003118 [Mycobacterium sp. MAA66]|uniref:restriction endonuclease n=1 Tax=Mycobacterium sp. MAA66 TaxID=3156297 RepID=UPI0035120AC3